MLKIAADILKHVQIKTVIINGNNIFTILLNIELIIPNHFKQIYTYISLKPRSEC